MSSKNPGKWVTSMILGAVLVLTPGAALFARTNESGVVAHSFNSPAVPVTSQDPGSHAWKFKKVDDDDDDGGGYFGFGFGSPWWGSGWYGNSYWGPPAYYYSAPRSGHVKIDTHRKNAQVYINGAYAGTIRERSKFTLKPGTYELEIRPSNGETFTTQVYVTRGNTVIVRPDFTHAG